MPLVTTTENQEFQYTSDEVIAALNLPAGSQIIHVDYESTSSTLTVRTNVVQSEAVATPLTPVKAVPPVLTNPVSTV